MSEQTNFMRILATKVPMHESTCPVCMTMTRLSYYASYPWVSHDVSHDVSHGVLRLGAIGQSLVR